MNDDVRRALEIVSVALTVIVAAPAVRDEWTKFRERLELRRVEQAERDARFYAGQASQFEAAWPEVLRDLRIIQTTGAAP